MSSDTLAASLLNGKFATGVADLVSPIGNNLDSTNGLLLSVQGTSTMPLASEDKAPASTATTAPVVMSQDRVVYPSTKHSGVFSRLKAFLVPFHEPEAGSHESPGDGCIPEMLAIPTSYPVQSTLHDRTRETHFETSTPIQARTLPTGDQPQLPNLMHFRESPITEEESVTGLSDVDAQRHEKDLLAQLETQIRANQDLVIQLAEKNANFDQLVTERDEMAHDLEKRPFLRTQVGETGDVKRESSALLQENEILKDENKRLREQHAGGQSAREWQSMHDKLASQVKARQAKLTPKVNQARTLHADLEEARSTVCKLGSQLAPSVRADPEACAQCEVKAAEITKLKSRLVENTTFANAQIHGAVEEIKALRVKLETQMTLTEEWEAKAGKLRADVDAKWQSRYDAKEVEVAALRADLDAKTTDVEALMSIEKDTMAKVLQTKCQEMGAEVAALPTKPAQASMEETVTQRQLNHKTALIKKWQSKHDILRHEAAQHKISLERQVALTRMWQSKYDKLRVSGQI
ncbi:hypothetical protein CspHIS471_0410010 [Cutaneotrichosporon sp. HIS471]|nr:hypothetical protein CspHIS471_0410010 [Cutaneotrichosporon sp. HIS471]